jgi:tape measure domain-containing protein
MSEIDPVILELRADLNRYTATLRSTTTTVDKLLGQQEKRAQRLEAEMRRSADGIASSLRGLAGVFAGVFGAREIGSMVDNFTRLQNALRVAGLEGANLAEVQEKLFALGARYGVSVNTLADLYGNVAQAGKSLGASQAELLTLTEAVSQSLLITGKSAAEASGATLGLVQALAAGTVRAEEYAQINEGGLRPLLEAAAAADRFKGDINALRAAIYDGTVSSEEFYRAILSGTSIVEGKASGATITLAGAFTALRNELTLYLGQAAASSGLTEALASAIRSLANNLDRVIPALATIAAIVGANYLVNVGRAVAATIALSGAATGAAGAMGLMGATSFALQARLAGAATTTEALAFATRGLAGAIAATGIGALIVSLGYLASQAESSSAFVDRLTASTEQLRNENDRMIDTMRQAGASVAGLGAAATDAAIDVENLNDSMSRAIGTALNLIATLNRAGVLQTASQIGQNRIERDRLANPDISRGPADLGNAIANRFGVNDDRIAALDAEYRELSRRLDIQTAAAAQGVNLNPSASTGSGGVTEGAKPKKSKPGRAGRGLSGPSADEIAARQASEINRLQQEELRARAQITDDANERANLERQILTLDYQQRKSEIENDGDLSRQQKDAQIEILQNLYGVRDATAEGGELVVTANQSLYVLAIERQRQAQIERDQADLADERYQAEAEQLRLQYDLADTQDQRRAIALQILEAEDRYLRSKLEAIIASEAATEVERERARIALASLQATAAARRESVARSEAGALDRYARDAKDADARVEEAAAQRIRDLNQTITDAMTNALGIKDPFLKDLISIFLDENVFGPLAEAFSKQGSGSGGLGAALGSIIGSIFGGGRASGGRVSAGTIYRVNEGASAGRTEFFRPDMSGQIMPLGQTNAIQSGGAQGGTVRIMIEEAPGFASRVRAEATGVAVEVQRATAPGIVNAAANETMRRFTRPRT